MTYSQLFASMEPRGGGRGRFNYHLKVLREAGVIQVQESHYGLSETGEAAVSFLEEVNRESNPRGWLNVPRRHVGPLLGFSILGLASALLLWSLLAPTLNVPPAQPLDAGWGVPISLETGEWETREGSGLISRGGIRHLTATVDNSGNGLAVWTERVTRQSSGGYSESTEFLHTANFVPGIGWGQITSYDTPWEASSDDWVWDPDENAYYRPFDVRIGADAAGNILALWSSHDPSRAWEVHASRLPASRYEWTEPTLLDRGESGHVSLREVEVSASGSAMAVWSVGESVYASSYVVGGWGSPVRFPRYLTDVAMKPNGDALAIWLPLENEADPFLWASVFKPSTGWEAPIRLGRPPKLVSDGSGTPELVDWSDMPTLIRAIGEGWPSMRLPWVWPGILTVDEKGDAVHAWGRHGYVGPDEPMFRSRYVRGTGWTSPHLVEPTTSLICALEGLGDSHVIFLWGWQFQPGPVFASTYAPSTGWTDREQVGPRRSNECAHLAVGPSGTAFLVGRGPPTPTSDEGGTIWANYFVKPLSLDRTIARLDGLELQFLLLAGVVVALLASNAIFLLLYYWYPRRGLASRTESEKESTGPPETGG